MVQILTGSQSEGVRLITQEDTKPFNDAIEDVVAMALGAVAPMWRSLLGESPDTIRNELLVAVPDAAGIFTPQISDITSVMYGDIREAQGLTTRHTAVATAAPLVSRTESLVRWAVGPMFGANPDPKLAFSHLAGGFVKVLMDQQRQTMIDNLVDDAFDGPMGYQRVPKPGCCAYCAMLASRSSQRGFSNEALYDTAESAVSVTGRGIPLAGWAAGARGRSPMGRRPRGPRDLGERYHDYCRCTAVPVFRSNQVQLNDDADTYYDPYLVAQEKVNQDLVLGWTESKAKDGSLSRKYHWEKRSTGQKVDKTSQILTWMRAETGAK